MKVVWTEWTIEEHTDYLGNRVPAQTMKTPHTEDCVQRTQSYKVRKDQYGAKWPLYCRYCSGLGTISYSENQSPYGSGEYWPMQTTDPCPKCSDNGRCPRCGRDIPESIWEAWCEEQYPCPFCGWSWGRDEGDALCEEPECVCYELLTDDGKPRTWREK